MNSGDKLSHFDSKGDVHMVDVGNKSTTHRIAVASGDIRMRRETLQMILDKNHKKGDVLGVARIAGIMATKRTAELIPLCHPLAITKVAIDLDPDVKNSLIRCTAQVETQGKTGVEMEALTAVQLTLLTVYDMCKAVDRGMVMSNIGLVEKSGGKSGRWEREN